MIDMITNTMTANQNKSPAEAQSRRQMMMRMMRQGQPPATTQNGEDENQDAKWNREHYAKYEARIPLRDGAKLRTAIYMPNDRSESYPILMLRTHPQSPTGRSSYGRMSFCLRLGREKRRTPSRANQLSCRRASTSCSASSAVSGPSLGEMPFSRRICRICAQLTPARSAALARERSSVR